MTLKKLRVEVLKNSCTKAENDSLYTGVEPYKNPASQYHSKQLTLGNF